MGQAKRRKDLGLTPEPTTKLRQKARIKRDNDLLGMSAMPMMMASLLGLMSRRKSPFQELSESRTAYRQEANEEEYNNQTPIKHMIIPDLEEVEEEE